ncbi:hypothetical protein VN12_26320 [Pirellula sp. SH-Sr6A]|uniref:hypothetical protein n=1 Tax=Pirellula sp. SH-Sr6A TaxID=1632865 RepID=UPI00078CB1D9|nr:hypothetical protein [Pirellula sp. SH-Sr6A]AMV35635.1 hypothetical protein VN12_26320 [Pirellula sp. SH-Sr6A]
MLFVVLGAFVIVGVLVAIVIRDSKKSSEASADEARRLKMARERLPVLAAKLEQSPDCELSQKELIQICQAFPQFARPVYDLALKAVAASGGSVAAKTFALNVGRASYSVGRPEGAPTVYDEQAILNDIRVRESAGRAG